MLKYAGSAWEECEEVSDGAIAAAKPFLIRHGLIDKGRPRDRRPTDEEHELLLELAARQNKRQRNKIDMHRVIRWQRASSRRISETCRVLWADWDRENHTLLVRKMKDPRNRNKNKLTALPDEAQALLVEMWDTRKPLEPRIFAYNHKSCGARYCLMKKELAKAHPGMFENLHLHDSRRDCGTRLIEIDGYSSEEAILVTGHESTREYERTYRRMDPKRFHLGPIAKRLAARQGESIGATA